MNQEESIALFEKCEAARKEALDSGKTEVDAHEAAKKKWNEWAEGLLKEKKDLEEQGLWEDNKDDWNKRAQVNFSSLCFLKHDEKLKEETQGGENKSPENKQDVKSIYFLGAEVSFRNYIFPDTAFFGESTFSGAAYFDIITFSGAAFFDGITISSVAYFRTITFSRAAYFNGNTFSGDAYFDGNTFSGDASFRGSTFSRAANFRGNTFSGDASFEGITISGAAFFDGNTFSGIAYFDGSTFSGIAYFDGNTFSGDAYFDGNTFSGDASFRGSTFSGVASFRGSTFSGDASFRGSTFKKVTMFATSTFKSVANFYGIQSDVSFDLSDTIFHTVPNFLEARFKNDEPPNLDNVKVRSQPLWTCGYSKDSDLVTQFRKLKKMSIQAHYNEGELEFHAQELRSSRFKTWKFKLFKRDWHLPIPLIWKASFWLSLAYGALSDFGRSIVRPILAWLILVIIFSGIYLSQTPPVEKVVNDSKGNTSYISATWQAFKKDQKCQKPVLFQPKNKTVIEELGKRHQTWKGFYEGMRKSMGLPIANYAPADKLLSHTNAPQEALYLSIKNGFVFIDWDRSEAALRTFGCLYGLQETKTSLVPTVPFWISVANIIQNILSAMLIFLFGLGLRNMLKLK